MTAIEREFAAPWGTGQYAEGHAPWWTSGRCDARGTFDRSHWHGGGKALHIINRSPRAANVYGTTQMPLQLAAGKKYQVTAWARANGLASAGGASIVVDDDWKIHPIQLPKGTYGWTKFTGTFVLPNSGWQLRNSERRPGRGLVRRRANRGSEVGLTEAEVSHGTSVTVW